MKTPISLRIVFFFLLSLVLLSSCEDEDISTTGTLQLVFTNRPSDLEAWIRPAENTDLVIMRLSLDQNGEARTALNVGNYSVQVVSSSFVRSGTGFQIIADRTTRVFWDDINDATVSY